MMKRRFAFFRHGLLAFLLGMWMGGTGIGWGQTLSESRPWRSAEGKVIQAELLVPGQGAGFTDVRLRQKDGKVFRLEVSRFHLHDQAVILAAYSKDRFRVEPSRSRESFFFYSQELDADDWEERTWFYIGSDEGQSWLRLALYSEPNTFSGGQAVLIGGGDKMVRLPYESNDVEMGRRRGPGKSSRSSTTYEGVDLLVPRDDADALLQGYADGNQKPLKLLLETVTAEGAKAFLPIPVSVEEHRGFSEVLHHYPLMADLGADYVWWATLQGRTPEDYRKEAEDPLRSWRNFEGTPLIPLRAWTDTLGEQMMAEVLGFQRELTVLRRKDGEILGMATQNFELDDLYLLALARLQKGFRETWHPMDEDLEYFYPKSWDGDARYRRQSILFAIDRETRFPRLVAQHTFGGEPTLEPKQIVYRGSELPDTGLTLTVEGEDQRLRSTRGVQVWKDLSADTVLALQGLREKGESLT
ncbi:MAG: hypothetical protein AAGJ31_15360, partial [Verrucomicrobiota bacterium]